MSGVPSGVSTGPVVDGEDVAIVSFDDIRWRGGENGADSFVSFGDWRGEELADGPIPGDASGFGEPASLLVGIWPPDSRRGDIVFLGDGGPLNEGSLGALIALEDPGEYICLGLWMEGGEYVRGEPIVCGDLAAAGKGIGGGIV